MTSLFNLKKEKKNQHWKNKYVAAENVTLHASEGNSGSAIFLW